MPKRCNVVQAHVNPACWRPVSCPAPLICLYWKTVLKFLLCVLVTVITIQAAEPWDRPFSPDTRAILEASKRTPPAQEGAVILLIDRGYSVHRGGAMDVVIRQVYRVDQQADVEDWSTLEQSYQPWYQQKPEIRARVISP